MWLDAARGGDRAALDRMPPNCIAGAAAGQAADAANLQALQRELAQAQPQGGTLAYEVAALGGGVRRSGAVDRCALSPDWAARRRR